MDRAAICHLNLEHPTLSKKFSTFSVQLKERTMKNKTAGNNSRDLHKRHCVVSKSDLFIQNNQRNPRK